MHNYIHVHTVVRMSCVCAYLTSIALNKAIPVTPYQQVASLAIMTYTHAHMVILVMEIN